MRVTATVLATLFLLSGAHAQSWTMYERFRQSYALPFASGFGTGASLLDPTITATVLGTTLRPPIDTGSRGMIVSQDLLTPPVAPKGRAGSLFYWSSGLRFSGIWTDTVVTFPDAVASGPGTPKLASATVPVLVVQGITCEPGNWPNACPDPGVTEPTTAPGDKTALNFGIGFDRTGHGTQPENGRFNQQYNPFLNLDAMRAGTMRAGYVIGLNGMSLGLTAADTGPGYAFAKLQPTGLARVPGSPPDWQPAFGQVALNGRIFAPGQGVIDVGISDMLLTLPGYPTTGTLPGSPSVTAYLLGLPGLAGYQFTAGAAGNTAPAPSSVALTPLQKGRWSSSKTTDTFLNTGRNPIAAFNYLYDAADGYLGLQRNGAAAATAFLTPAIAGAGDVRLPPRFATDLPLYLSASTILHTADTALWRGALSGPGSLRLRGGSIRFDCTGTYTGRIVVDGAQLVLAPPVHASVRTLNGGSVTVLPHPYRCAS